MHLGIWAGWWLAVCSLAVTRGQLAGAVQGDPFPTSAVARLWSEIQDLPGQQRLEWEQRLGSELVQRVLQAPAPALEDVIALSKRMYGAQNGLEHPRFLASRARLDQWIERQLVRRSRAMQAEAVYRRGCLESNPSGPTDQALDVQTVIEHLNWLEAAGRDDGLRQRLGEQYCYPNIIIHVRRSLFASQLDEFRQEIQRSRCAQNWIAGACVTGPTHVRGLAAADLPPNRQEARVALRFQGVVTTPANTAVKGNVRVFSRGATEFEGSAWIFWRNGALVSEPTQLHASTQATLHGVDVPLMAKRRVINGLLSRFALKKAEEIRPQGEFESARLAEQQLSEEFDRELRAKLADANSKINEYYHAPLTRLGVATKVTSAAGTEHVAIGFQALNRSGLGTYAYPRSDAIQGAISVAVHESVIGQLSQPSLGGAWWSDYDLAQFQKELIGENSHHFRLGPHFPSWAVQFHWRQPLTTTITKDQVTFWLKLDGVRINGDVQHHPMRIRASYRLRLTDYGVEFSRVGEVSVEPLRGDAAIDPLSTVTDSWDQQVAELMREKFSSLFEEIVFLDGLSPPAGGTFDALARMQSRYLSLEPEWIRLGFDPVQDSPDATPDVVSENLGL